MWYQGRKKRYWKRSSAARGPDEWQAPKPTGGNPWASHAPPTTMKILVANLGSTSFKYRLFDMADEKVLARGGVERIGSEQARWFTAVGGKKTETVIAAKDHAVAVRL